MNRVSLISLCLLTAPLLLGGCKKKTAPAAFKGETEQERAQSIQSAFVSKDATGAGAIAPDSAEFRALDEVVTNIGRGNRKSDAKRVRDCISPDAMVRHLEEKKLASFKSKAERAGFMTGFEKGLMSSFSQLVFDQHKLVRAEMIAPGQAMVLLRLHDEEMGVVTKQRWWLVQEEGGWKLYDFEDLDGATRASTLMGAMFAGMKGGKEPWVDPLLKLIKTSQGEGDVLEQVSNGRTYAEEILKNNAPEEVQSMARITITGAMFAEQEFEEALKQLAEMDKISNPSPVRHYMRAGAFAALGREDEALAAYEAYAKELGWDFDVHEMVASIHFSKGNKALAYEHAMKGLADNKDATACLSLAAVTATPDQVPGLVKYFETTSDPEVAYEEAIDHAFMEEDLPRARDLLELLKTSLPKSDLVEVYESDLAEAEKEAKEGAEAGPDAEMDEEEGEGGAIIGAALGAAVGEIQPGEGEKDEKAEDKDEEE